MEKGGFGRALEKAGFCLDEQVSFVDEMRLGLHGQVRRVLAPRGVKVIQTKQMRYRAIYLLLVVVPEEGALRWRWLEHFNQKEAVPAIAEVGVRLVVWDGAKVHKSKKMEELGIKRVLLPPYSPELNPAERVFEEVRRAIEGLVFGSVEEKKEAAEGFLTGLAADPHRVRRLCRWGWIQSEISRCYQRQVAARPTSLRRNGIRSRPDLIGAG